MHGAEAEEEIWPHFGSIGTRYHVFHDISSQYGNLSHLVIARSGAIFFIETKLGYGKVSIQHDQVYLKGNLPEKDFIKQASKNAM